MKAKIYALICGIVSFALLFIAGCLRMGEGFDPISPVQDAERHAYIIHRMEQIPREDIAAFIAKDGRLYVYFDHTALVNVYGTDGSFQYGIQISTIRNGRGDIATRDGLLYIKSRQAVIFVFRDDQLLECIGPETGYEAYVSVREIFAEEKSTVSGGISYQLSESSGSILRQDTMETVCDFPQKSHVAERLLIVGLFVLSLSLYGVEKLFCK